MSTIIDLDNLGTAGFTIEGPTSYAHAGQSVSTAGDFNGDGFEDVIVGAPYATYGFIGSSYVLFGHAGGFGTIDLSNLSPSDGFAINSVAADYSATSVSDAGDINGDGFDDLVIGGSSGYYGNSNSHTYVVFGRASGSGTIDLSHLSASNGFTILDTPASAYGSGHTVSAAGDVNGDGLEDMIIGASGGSAYVVFGDASGFDTINLQTLDPSAGFAIRPGSGGNIGYTVGSAGDVNGDGIDDVIVGAAGTTGAAYVIFGHQGAFGTVDVTNLMLSQGFKITAPDKSIISSVAGAGDFNGDGLADLIIGSSNADVAGTDSGAAYIIYGRADGVAIDLGNLSATAGIVVSGGAAGDFATNGGVASAGDVNGDGFSDVIIGAPASNTDGGTAYVIYGRAAGATAIDLATLAPADGFVLQGHGNDFAGASVSAAGDVDGDGYDDIIVGAPNSDAASQYAGKAYVIFGAATPPMHVTGTDASETLMGSNADDDIDGLGGDDRLYGRGGNDRLTGGLGNDLLDGGAGIDKMFGGSGDDTYIVRDTTDYAYEDAGEGTDRVISFISVGLRANVENLTLTGASAINGKGNDLGNIISGNSGANKLDGLGGDDRLVGHEGNDTLTGGAGIDRLYGGTGNDTYYVTDATDYVYENAAEGTDRVYSTVSLALRANVENLTLTGTAAINGYGNELANSIAGNGAANALKGGAGGDKLYGQGGSDALSGEGGNDWLEGGHGQDRLYGGTGSDSFVFRDGDFGGATTSAADRIYDFNQADHDHVRLNLVDADTTSAGDQAFHFLGTAAFDGTAGALRYAEISGTTFVSGDTNGDGVTDFMIRIDGLHTLTSSDFVL